MNKQDNSIQTNSENVFAQVIMDHFKCKLEDIDFQIIETDQQAYMEYNGEGYKIRTWESLRQGIVDIITDPGEASCIDLSIWLTATRDTVSIERILPNLIRKIKGQEDAQLLHLALGISSFTHDPYQSFWTTLERIDKESLLMGNAIVSVCEACDGSAFIDDLTELMILDGGRVYNMVEGGIFETIYHEGKNGETRTFYLYSAAI